MSSLLRSLTDEVRPEYGLFAVANVIDGRLVGSSVDGTMEPRTRITAGHDGLIVETAYSDRYVHTVHNRFERWAGPPPVDDWEELWSGRLLLKSELIGVEPWAAGYPHDMEFDLGQGHTTWSTRVATKVLRTEQEPGFRHAIARIELYKIQFWT
ncbi:hypothetical protein ACFYOK_16985 [Microbispora bryophytorum]|uniref:hypothetical protein n=1 Tax=Microbispora bryophytorum TaxID=1460882 RepID=UPI00340D7AFB